MRGLLAGLLGLLIVAPLPAQEKKPAPPPRFGVAADLEVYPQNSAKETLRSVAKALDRKRFEYVLAQLSDPAFVDEAVEKLGGKFAELVREFSDHLNDDPKRAQEFRKFLTMGEVAESGTSATVSLKDVPNRQISLRQIEGRWYILNDDSAEKKK